MRWLWLALLLIPAFAQTPKAIVVLGAAQYNGRPSPVFAARLEAARALFASGAGRLILVTGGKQNGDRYSEGEAGCAYLARKGVPKSQLRCETSSRSTWENLLAAKRILRGYELVLVTDAPHLPRALLLARKLGLKVRGYPVQGNFSWRYRLRERLLFLAAVFGLNHL